MTNTASSTETEVSQASDSDSASDRKDLKVRILKRTIIALNVLVFYVLSIGPMFWMWYEAENLGTTPFLRIVYAPLRALCYYEPIETWMNDYINWWIV
jgi:hypothetical protein